MELFVKKFARQLRNDEISKSLSLAARNNRISVISYLNKTFSLDFGTKNEDGNTALHLAALYGHSKLTAQLVTSYRSGEITVLQKFGLSTVEAA